jgi:uncharacterized protein
MAALNRITLVLIALLFAAPVSAADFKKGVAAYKTGDYATVLREWKPLAEQGDAKSQYNLGIIYRKGIGVPQDYKQAVKWYRKAANQGHAPAQLNIGFMYAKGHGVPQNYKKAHMWFNIAFENGLKLAIKNRDVIAKKLTPADISKAQAMAREWMKKFEARKLKKQDENFDQMMEKTRQSQKTQHDPARPITISQIDYVRQQIARCWNLPAGVKNAENFIVEIKVSMNLDGTVRDARIQNQSRMLADGLYRKAAESALRAVLNPLCQPFKLPSDNYSVWKIMTLTFNPREMFGI